MRKGETRVFAPYPAAAMATANGNESKAGASGTGGSLGDLVKFDKSKMKQKIRVRKVSDENARPDVCAGNVQPQSWTGTTPPRRAHGTDLALPPRPPLPSPM